MSNELRILGVPTGSTVRAVISRDSDEKVWQTTTNTFVTRVAADYANYAVTMTETPSGASIWLGDFPTLIDPGTICNVDYYQLSGATLTSSDSVLGGERIRPNGEPVADEASILLLASVEEYKLARGISGTDDDEKYEFLLTAASRAIENYCNGIKVEATLTEFYNGTGFNFLKLRSKPASGGIVSVTYNPYSDNESISTSDLAVTSSGYLYFKPDADSGTHFTEGYQNYQVVYTTDGAVPYDLRQACILVAAAMEAKSDSDNLIKSKSVGDVKIVYDWGFADLSDPIFSDAKMLLAPHKAIDAF